MVEVQVTAVHQKLLGGNRRVEAQGATVAEVLSDLDRRFPGVRAQIASDGELHRFVNVYLNDEDIRYLDKLNTPLRPGDTIAILPALAGGA
ncbi:MAG: MoaD/ThiS family protein [Chloroflexi bacterium]|nr:MoaD/ThiS family protein [Chloroflexota bacterium]